MTYHTIEHKITSIRGWKRPLYSGSRVYGSEKAVKGRINWLKREYGEDNVVHMAQKDDPSTEIVYVRLY